VAVAAAGLLVAWVVRERRVLRGRCPACGRAESLPHGLLKLARSLGWTGGLTGHAFDGVPFTSPGFGDTAVLTRCSSGWAPSAR
jgi:hypothetical protein